MIKPSPGKIFGLCGIATVAGVMVNFGSYGGGLAIGLICLGFIVWERPS